MSETNWTDEDHAELTDLGATEYGALVRDAKRYRWLREQVEAFEVTVEWNAGPYETPPCNRDELDAAIDAAMEAAK